ncbi:MAG: alpha/beta hydrolase family protein [Candidatus Hodarchaeota archaeon]
MRLWIFFLVFPAFVIVNVVMIFIVVNDIDNLILGIVLSIISIFVGIAVFRTVIYRPESYYNNVSRSTVDAQKVEIKFDDGVKSAGVFYRSVSETIITPNGRRYNKPRPTIIFFHGFWRRKEANELNLITLAHMGYVAVAFDQRGHGEASGNRAEWYKLYTDVDNILDLVCSFEDVKKGSLCCIGKSMGGTSVLTKCYQDERVAMVIGISALHSAEILVGAKFPFLSSGWFVRRVISKVVDERALKLCAHYYLKNDPELNKNRVFLIHGELDNIFPPSLTFELNKIQSGIPDDHAILLQNCGHSMKGQESLIFGIILKWILENKSMDLKNNV